MTKRLHPDPACKVPCWVHGCPESGGNPITQAVPIRLHPEIVVSVVFCGKHLGMLRDEESEEWPAQVADDRVAA